MQLQLAVLQVFESFFVSPKKTLAIVCIHKLVPEVIKYIQKWKNSPATKGQSDVIIKATVVLEGLLKNTPNERSESSIRLLFYNYY